MLRKHALFYILILSFSLRAQDMHFSQATNFPLLINPAFSGNYQEKARAIFSARNQSLRVPNTAFSGVYNTLGASFDAKILPDVLDQNTWSVGIMALSDYAGSGTLATNQVLLTTAYSLSMDRYGKSFLSLGGQIGFTNRRLFSQDLLFESQVNEYDFDPRLPNLEPYINGASQSSLLLNLGVLYQQQLGDRAVSQLGFSLYNVNQPNQYFYTNSGENIYARLNVTGGIMFKLDDYSNLYPSIIYMKQGNFTSTNVGFSYGREINEQLTLTAGLRSRLGDAFILLAGMKYNRFLTTISYDMTTSSLSKANKSIGAFELNLTYFFGEKSEGYSSDKLYCPSY